MYFLFSSTKQVWRQVRKSSQRAPGIRSAMYFAMYGVQRSLPPLTTRVGTSIVPRHSVTSKSHSVPVGVNSFGPHAVR